MKREACHKIHTRAFSVMFPGWKLSGWLLVLVKYRMYWSTTTKWFRREWCEKCFNTLFIYFPCWQLWWQTDPLKKKPGSQLNQESKPEGSLVLLVIKGPVLNNSWGAVHQVCPLNPDPGFDSFSGSSLWPQTRHASDWDQPYESKTSMRFRDSFRGP